MAKKHEVIRNGKKAYRRTENGKTIEAKNYADWRRRMDEFNEEKSAVYALADKAKTSTIKALWPEFKVSTTARMKDRTTPAPNTLEERTEAFKYILPVLGDVKLSKLTDGHIYKFYSGINAYCIENNRSSVLEHVEKVLKQFLNWAVRSTYIREIPVSPRTTDAVAVWIANHKANKIDRKFIVTEDILGRMLDRVKGEDYEIVFQLWAHTGMRFNEALVASWENIDFSTNSMKITASKSDVSKASTEGTIFEGMSQIVLTPKTEAGIRNVLLHEDIIDLLEATPVEERKGYFFSTRTGKPVNGSSFRRIFERVMKDIGIEGVRPNDLRHYAITDLSTLAISNGIDLKCVSDMVGHKDIRTTLRVYNEARPEHNQMLGTLLANRRSLAVVA